MYKAGFTLSLNGGRVSRTALVEKTELNAEYDKLLEAALAELGDMYFSLMSPHLGSRYDDMCREWSAQGAGAYLGGAPAVYLGLGSTTTLHVDHRDAPLSLYPEPSSCTVFVRLDANDPPPTNGSAPTIAAELLTLAQLGNKAS